MNRFGKVAVSAGAVIVGGASAQAATLVFDANDATTYNDGHVAEQAGNNSAYYGDDVHLDHACPQIADVCIEFGYYTYDPGRTYTPQVRVDLFAVDSAGIPVDSNTNDTLSYTPIASAFNSSVTFTGSNYNNGGDTSSTHQQMCFDFTGQTGAANLQDFAFAYRDENPNATVVENSGSDFGESGNGFSVFTNNDAAPTVGSSNPGFLSAFPNSLSATTFSTAFTANGDPANAIDASITCVPEPASLGLLGLGSLLTLRRRKA